MARPWPWKSAQKSTVSSAVKFIYSEQFASIVTLLLVNHFCFKNVSPNLASDGNPHFSRNLNHQIPQNTSVLEHSSYNKLDLIFAVILGTLKSMFQIRGGQNFSCKGPDCKYFRLCKSYRLNSLPLQHKSGHGTYQSERTWLCVYNNRWRAGFGTQAIVYQPL